MLAARGWEPVSLGRFPNADNKLRLLLYARGGGGCL